MIMNNDIEQALIDCSFFKQGGDYPKKNALTD
jgi:hypothetical protein